MAMDLLQYPGVALGLVGATLVSQRASRARRWGFLLWIGSNALLISWAVGAEAWGLLSMYRIGGGPGNRAKESPLKSLRHRTLDF